MMTVWARSTPVAARVFSSGANWGMWGRPRGEVPAFCGGPFPRGLPPNPPYEFPRSGLSSDYSVSGVIGRTVWMVSWHGRQTMRVFRRLLVMMFIHSSRLMFPVPVRSASLRI